MEAFVQGVSVHGVVQARSSFACSTQQRSAVFAAKSASASSRCVANGVTGLRATSELDQLKEMTVIVADTGDIDSIKKYKPTDATTNPSLIYAASQMPQYKSIVDSAVQYGVENSPNGASVSEVVELVRDKLSALFGAEISKIVPGYVSIEVDARLSFDYEASVAKAYRILKLAEESGLPRERVLIKLATTWEGCRVAECLQKDGINCNMTLLFSIAQAVAAADAGAKLISPFVGRILDWYKKARGVDSIPASEDPGVLSVRQIHEYYKCFGYDTIVMGASFRSKDEVLELAGCDRLTIAPKLLQELKEGTSTVVRKLGPPETCQAEKIEMDEPTYRWMMNEDPMATEKLAEGIRNFAKDTDLLDGQLAILVKEKLGAAVV
uniref:transaldolase n=1 Tax=Timspurckia oligopyrenoides TaxID=708627 RepID=A0A7S1EPR1_9RHOD|mmetsp:Transcript_10504/g.18941  ORF Transcript_10504/g.18941 Transcript_10504/m.18941 type:complete len:381 (+) Transcript_10504:126-1268(+)